MDAEEQLRKLKQITPITKEEKRKQLRTSIVLALATLLSVLFLVYAFIQKLEADKQAELATEMKMEAERQRAEADKHRLTAEHERHQAMAARDEAERQRALAEEALANCQKSKR
jgi:choline-glycine betaine transporter